MINLVVALEPEAKPLIGHFLLELTHKKPFRIYQNNSIRLIISGMRKAKSARAVSFLHELFSNQSDQAWLNIGIAGHRDYEVGTGILAHKITDQKSKKSWYPALTFRPSCATESLLTVNRAESRYKSPHVYEMEASGFYEAALRYSTAELVHCYKVISDNAKSSHWKVTPGFAEKIIGNRLNDITYLVTELKKRAKLLNSLQIKVEELKPFLERWHFTVTQQFQLRRILRRLKTLTSDQAAPEEFGMLQNSDQVLAALKNRAYQVPIYL